MKFIELIASVLRMKHLTRRTHEGVDRAIQNVQRVAPVAPTAPIIEPAGLTHERYADGWRKVTEEEDQRHMRATENVVRINNANVTRDYGAGGIVDESFKTAPLSAEEQADIDKFVEPKYAGVCPICGGENYEHKPGCAPEPGGIV